MTKNLFKAPLLGFVAMTLMTSVAMAAKPIGGGGDGGGKGGGSKGGGGDTGPAVTASLDADNGSAICNWSAQNLGGGEIIAYCSGLSVKATYQCGAEMKSSEADFYKEGAITALKGKGGKGVATLVLPLPSVEGTCSQVCTVEFSGFSAGVKGVGEGVPVNNTVVEVNAC